MTEIKKQNLKMNRFWVIKALNKIHGRGDCFVMDESRFTNSIRAWVTYDVTEAKLFATRELAIEYLGEYVIAKNDPDMYYWEIAEVFAAAVWQKIDYKPMGKTPHQMAFQIFVDCRTGIRKHPEGSRMEDRQALAASLVVVSYTSTHDLGKDSRMFWDSVRSLLEGWIKDKDSIITDKL